MNTSVNESQDPATVSSESLMSQEQGVEAYDIHTRKYRPASLVNRSAPSRAGDGWYVQWNDVPERSAGDEARDLPRPSSGGWVPLHYIRPRTSEAKG